jgi:hypothetical protein
MESEIQMYKNSQPLDAACSEYDSSSIPSLLTILSLIRIITTIKGQPEPFCGGPRAGDPNPWLASSGEGSGCVIC